MCVCACVCARCLLGVDLALDGFRVSGYRVSEFRVYAIRVYALVLQGLRKISGFRVLKFGVPGRGGVGV